MFDHKKKNVKDLMCHSKKNKFNANAGESSCKQEGSPFLVKKTKKQGLFSQESYLKTYENDQKGQSTQCEKSYVGLVSMKRTLNSSVYLINTL